MQTNIVPTSATVQQVGAAVAALIAHLGLQIGDEHIRSILLRFIVCMDPPDTGNAHGRLSVYDTLQCDSQKGRHLFITLAPSDWVATARRILAPSEFVFDYRPADVPEMVARWALIIEASRHVKGTVAVYVQDCTDAHTSRKITIEAGTVAAPEGGATADPKRLKQLRLLLKRLTAELASSHEGSA